MLCLEIHRDTFIKKRIITTNIDDLTCEALLTPKDVNLPDVSIYHKGETYFLFYRDRSIISAFLSNISKNGTFVRTLESRKPVLIQRYICNDRGHSFNARPSNYIYGNYFSNEAGRNAQRD